MIMGLKITRRGAIITSAATLSVAGALQLNQSQSIFRPFGEPDTTNPIPEKTEENGPLGPYASNLILIDAFDSFIDTTLYGQGTVSYTHLTLPTKA